MSFQAHASGSLLKPQLDDFTLKIPLFGSSDYNAVVSGKVEFTEQRSWSEANLTGQLKIDPLALSRARLLPVFRNHLPEELVTEGNVSLYSRFEGTWNHLRIGALVRAENSEIRYGDWLRKPAKSPAEIKARLSRRNQRLTIHESELTLGAAKTVFSGAVQDIDAPRLYFKLQADDAPLAVWTPLSNGAVTAKSGNASWHLAIERMPAGRANQLEHRRPADHHRRRNLRQRQPRQTGTTQCPDHVLRPASAHRARRVSASAPRNLRSPVSCRTSPNRSSTSNSSPRRSTWPTCQLWRSPSRRA